VFFAGFIRRWECGKASDLWADAVPRLRRLSKIKPNQLEFKKAKMGLPILLGQV
jgi:hypothetical protein